MDEDGPDDDMRGTPAPHDLANYIDASKVRFGHIASDTPAIALPPDMAQRCSLIRMCEVVRVWLREIALALQDGESPISTTCRRLRLQARGEITSCISACLPHLPHDERALVAGLIYRMSNLDALADGAIPQTIVDLGEGANALHTLQLRIERQNHFATQPGFSAPSPHDMPVAAALADLRAYVNQIAEVARLWDERMQSIREGREGDLKEYQECFHDPELLRLLANAEVVLDRSGDIRAGELDCFRRQDGIDFERLRIWLEPWHTESLGDMPLSKEGAVSPAILDVEDCAAEAPQPDRFDDRAVRWIGKRIYLGRDTQVSRLFWLLAKSVGRAHSLGEVQRAVDGMETNANVCSASDEIVKAGKRLRKAFSKLKAALRVAELDDHFVVHRGGTQSEPEYSLIRRHVK